jgi:hypothetical protein
LSPLTETTGAEAEAVSGDVDVAGVVALPAASPTAAPILQILPVQLLAERVATVRGLPIVAAGLTDELAVLGDAPTGLTVALESAERDRTFLTYLGVNAGWGPELITPDALRCDNLLLRLLRRSRPAGRGGARAARDRAGRRGAHVLRHRLGPGRLPRGNELAGPGAAAVSRRVPAQRGRGPRAQRVLGDPAGGACPAGGLRRLGGRQAGSARLPGGRTRRRRADGGRAGGRRRRHHRGRGRLQRRPRARPQRRARWPQALQDATRFASTIIARPPGERHRWHQFDGTAVE